MEIYVVEGATLKCSNGTQTSTLMVPDDHGVYLREKKRANQNDFMGNKSIFPFGLCKKNDMKPCIPTTLPWQLIKTDVLLDGFPTVLNTSICVCVAFSGIIKVEEDGQ